MTDYTRHREATVREVNGTLYWMYQSNPSATPVISGTYISERDHDKIVCDDEVHVNYKERIAKGEVIVGPFSKVETLITSGGGSFIAQHTDGRKYYTDVGGGGSVTRFMETGNNEPCPDLSGGEVPDYLANAKLEVLAKIDSATYSLAEDIGEMLLFTPKIITAAGNLAARLGARAAQADRVARTARVTRFSKSRIAESESAARDAWLRAPANHWAQYRFGILPALQSLEGVSYAMQDHVRALRRPRERVASTGSYNYTNTDIYSSGLAKYERGISKRCNGKAIILYERNTPRTLFDDLDIRKKAIPKTAWNLVPLSFMVDRVINISGMFAGLGNLADSNIRILAACTSKQEVRNNYKRGLSRSSSGGWTYTVSGDLYVTTQITKTRSLWRPTVWDTIPTDFAGKLFDTRDHILDALALVVQRAKRN